MPIEARMARSRLSTLTGSSSVSRTRFAIPTRALRVVLGHDERELVAAQPADQGLGPRVSSRRAATASSTPSPAAWPRLSLISLKPSRSSSMSASGAWSAQPGVDRGQHGAPVAQPGQLVGPREPQRLGGALALAQREREPATGGGEGQHGRRHDVPGGRSGRVAGRGRVRRRRPPATSVRARWRGTTLVSGSAVGRAGHADDQRERRCRRARRRPHCRRTCWTPELIR